MSLSFLLISAFFAAGGLYVVLFVGWRERHLPAGSPTLPVLGNIHQMPKKGTHQFTRWAQQYGGLYTLKLGTGTLAVIKGRLLVKELIDKKSTIYSGLPSLYVVQQTTGGDHILMMDYGTQWRETRKLLPGSLMEGVVEE
jgi:hypothetical protein